MYAEKLLVRESPSVGEGKLGFDVIPLGFGSSSLLNQETVEALWGC